MKGRVLHAMATTKERQFWLLSLAMEIVDVVREDIARQVDLYNWMVAVFVEDS